MKVVIDVTINNATNTHIMLFDCRMDEFLKHLWLCIQRERSGYSISNRDRNECQDCIDFLVKQVREQACIDAKQGLYYKITSIS